MVRLRFNDADELIEGLRCSRESACRELGLEVRAGIYELPGEGET